MAVQEAQCTRHFTIFIIYFALMGQRPVREALMKTANRLNKARAQWIGGEDEQEREATRTSGRRRWRNGIGMA